MDIEISKPTPTWGDPPFGGLFRFHESSGDVYLRVDAPPDVAVPSGYFFAVNLSKSRSYFFRSSNESHTKLTQLEPLKLQEEAQ